MLGESESGEDEREWYRSRSSGTAPLPPAGPGRARDRHAGRRRDKKEPTKKRSQTGRKMWVEEGVEMRNGVRN